MNTLQNQSTVTGVILPTPQFTDKRIYPSPNFKSVACGTKQVGDPNLYLYKLRAAQNRCGWLQKRLQLKDSTICKLKMELKAYHCKDLQNMSNEQQRLFANQSKDKNNCKIIWKPENIGFALSIYLKSSAAYTALRSFLKLPCINTLKNHTKQFLKKLGCCSTIMDAMSVKMGTLSEHERLVFHLLCY